MFILIYLLVVINKVISIDAARILAVFPTPSISHQVVFRHLTQELARRGHEVVVITTDPAFSKEERPANLTEVDVHDISYAIWRNEFLKLGTGIESDVYMQVKAFFEITTTCFEKQLQTSEIQNMIKNKNITFDLLLTESCIRPTLGFSHKYKVPVIPVSSLGAVFDNYYTVGASTHPIIYPPTYRLRLYNLTFWEIIMELCHQYVITHFITTHESVENEMIKGYFGIDTPDLSKLSNNIHMLFVNVHPIWERNYPVPPGVIYMGSLRDKPAKELPEDLKKQLDASVHGVIYMSFGTNVNPSALPPEKIQIFVKVFSQLPYDVLWKWDKDELPGRSKNIYISKWFPQFELLGHEKIKLFITQGGMQSSEETIVSGVPFIGIPILGDQWYNIEKNLYHKIGVKLDLETLTEVQLRDAINDVIGDENYQRNIIKLRTLFLDQPQRPLERAVWWTEHVLRHGGARHLRAPAANMSWAEYFELELILIFLTAVSVVLALFIFVVRSLYRRVLDYLGISHISK